MELQRRLGWRSEATVGTALIWCEANLFGTFNWSNNLIQLTLFVAVQVQCESTNFMGPHKKFMVPFLTHKMPFKKPATKSEFNAFEIVATCG